MKQTEGQGNPKNGRKCLHTRYLTRGSYAQCIKNFHKLDNNNNKTNSLIKKWTDDRINISPKKIYKWPTIYEKMLNVTGHQGNANQNHSEIPPHTRYKGNRPKRNNQKNQIMNVRKEVKRMVGGDVNW